MLQSYPCYVMIILTYSYLFVIDFWGMIPGKRFRVISAFVLTILNKEQ